MGSFDFLQFQQDTAAQVTDACRKASIETILEAFKLAADRAEPLLESHSGDRSLIACRAGCSTCCVVNVSTLVPEGIAICHYIRQQAPAYEQDILDRLESIMAGGPGSG